jgi:hypothetical protein
MLMFAVYANIGAGYIVPIIVIFVISRLFIMRAQTGNTG